MGDLNAELGSRTLARAYDGESRFVNLHNFHRFVIHGAMLRNQACDKVGYVSNDWQRAYNQMIILRSALELRVVFYLCAINEVLKAMSKFATI